MIEGGVAVVLAVALAELSHFRCLPRCRRRHHLDKFQTFGTTKFAASSSSLFERAELQVK